MAKVVQIGLGLLALAAPVAALAGEHVTLKNGQEFDCVKHEVEGDKVRLYVSTQSYVVVAAERLLQVESTPDAVATQPAKPETPAATMTEMMARAGAAYRIDVDLLASVIHAESGGHTNAVSRAGARGLMQLMPATAAELGVTDSFVAEQNIAGCTAYLDQLLTRYHDDVKKALAAYNAGPAAVDKYHGVPPFRETRAYVTRVILEYNRRKTELLKLNKSMLQVAAK